VIDIIEETGVGGPAFCCVATTPHYHPCDVSAPPTAPECTPPSATHILLLGSVILNYGVLLGVGGMGVLARRTTWSRKCYWDAGRWQEARPRAREAACPDATLQSIIGGPRPRRRAGALPL